MAEKKSSGPQTAAGAGEHVMPPEAAAHLPP
jgi:hypothetical protein